jgi:hypothetical protein
MSTSLADSTDPGFDREQFIDRRAEQAIFAELLERRDEARILAIRAESGSGKSQLLRMLESNCRRAKVPVALVSPEPESDPLAMANKVGESLRRRGLEFKALQAMEWARTTGDFTRIGGSDKPEVAIADARGANFENAINPELVGKKIEAGIFIEAPPRELQALPPEVDNLAREASLEAFVTDLRRHCDGGSTVAILFDHYEKAPSSVREWFEDMLLEPLFFDLDGRPPHLVLAVAGQAGPPFATKWADDAVKRVVRPRALGDWEKEDLAHCCTVEGYDPTEAELDSLFNLTRGMVPLDIVQTVRLLAKTQQRQRGA